MTAYDDDADRLTWTDAKQIPVTCRYCRTPMLYWTEAPQGVILCDADGTPHTCKFSNNVLKQLSEITP